MDTQTIIVTIIGAVFASQGFWAWVQNRTSRKSALTRGVMGLLFSEICCRSEVYIERGSVTKDEFRDLEKYLYEPYRELEGNGTAEKYMEDVKKLPIKEG